MMRFVDTDFGTRHDQEHMDIQGTIQNTWYREVVEEWFEQKKRDSATKGVFEH